MSQLDIPLEQKESYSNPEQEQNSISHEKSINSIRKKLFASITQKTVSPSLDFSRKWKVKETSEESYISSMGVERKNNQSQSKVCYFKRAQTEQIQEIENHVKQIIHPRTKVEINEQIKRSNNLIKMIRWNRKQMNQSKIRRNEKIKTQGNEQLTYLTNPNHSYVKKIEHQPFSYLNRKALQLSRRQISPQAVHKFFSENQNLQLSLEVQNEARKFLLNKMHSDYQNYGKVGQMRIQLREEKMRKVIVQKERLYLKDYGKRISCPYFSFLSLPPLQKKLVLQSQSLKSSVKRK